MTAINREIIEDQMARLLLTGMTMKKCAQQLGIHYNTARRYAKSERFLKKLAGLKREMLGKLDETIVPDLRERLHLAARTSLQVLIAALHSPNERIQVKAAADLLDRNPNFSRTGKVRAVSNHPIIMPDQLALLAQTAREIDEERRTRQAPVFDAQWVSNE